MGFLSVNSAEGRDYGVNFQIGGDGLLDISFWFDGEIQNTREIHAEDVDRLIEYLTKKTIDFKVGDQFKTNKGEIITVSEITDYGFHYDYDDLSGTGYMGFRFFKSLNWKRINSTGETSENN